MKDTLKVGYITKGVTFNCDDPDQKALLDHALQRKNFSGYIKRLIQRDYEHQPKTPIIKTKSGGIKIDLTQR